MHKAYDTILQSEVSADLAAQNRSFEPYRYECACCGQEVYIAATHSAKMVPHFKHRNGNNYIECEIYVGRFGAINIDSRSRKSNRKIVEFYFEKNTKTFNLGLCFSIEEIKTYEQSNVMLELRSTVVDRAFYTLMINRANFAPNIMTLIPINKFSFSYFLSNTFNRTACEYDFFRSDNTPLFFKLKANDSNYKAKLVRSKVLYTNVSYFVVFQSQYSQLKEISFFNGICVEDKFLFETMGKKFLGIVLTIKNRTVQIEKFLSYWGYQLEASEILTLLWPPSVLTEDVSTINSDYVFLYSSFELQAHGNINVHSEDFYRVTNDVSKVSVKTKTKVFKKNAEITIDKSEKHSSDFNEIPLTESSASIYTVGNNGTYYLFNHFGVKRLSEGQSVSLTPQDEIRHYDFGYLTSRIYPRLQEELAGEYLLADILSHYRRTEVFDKSVLSSCVFSETASQYIKKCETSGLINTMVKQFIEEGLL